MKNKTPPKLKRGRPPTSKAEKARWKIVKFRILKALYARAGAKKRRSWTDIFLERMLEIDEGVHDRELYLSLKLVLRVAEGMIISEHQVGEQDDGSPEFSERGEELLNELEPAREVIRKLDRVTERLVG